MDVKDLSPSVFSFMGDAVYSLLTREKLSYINRPSGELHSLSAKAVNANAQKRGFEVIEPVLTEEELGIFKRGRNFRTHNVPKGADFATYHTATGLETLFGYLYLKGDTKRINFLFSMIWEDLSEIL